MVGAMRVGLIGCLLWSTCGLSASAAAPAHPSSISHSRVTVQGSFARLELRCQALSVLEVLPADADGDGRLEPDELGTIAEPLGRYVDEHYSLVADSGGDPQRGRRLSGELTGLALDEPGPGAPAAEQWVELVLDYRTDALITDLLFDVTVFMAGSPGHRDLCVLTWNGETMPEALFAEGAAYRYFAPASQPAPRPALDWVRLGVDHILGGWDHLAFVLALIVSARDVRGLLWVVTAFTLAHSVTLALAALEVVTVPARTVEIAIAASILWIGVVNLASRRQRSRWPEAFVIGLVHGLGFASFLGAALLGEPRRLPALAGFNIGVELGQLAVVLVVVLPLLVLRRLRPERGPSGASGRGEWLAPRWLRLPVSAAVALAGAWWLIERAGWIA